MINPYKDLVILRGWPRTKYANREYHFTRDNEDQLLHCKQLEFRALLWLLNARTTA